MRSLFWASLFAMIFDIPITISTAISSSPEPSCCGVVRSIQLLSINWRLSMEVKDALFIFGLVFIGIPLIGLASVAVSAMMGMI
jgi:hypothetical protein